MPQMLWMLRHGDAEPHGTRPDAERRLTELGRTQASHAGAVLAALEVPLEALYTSPRIRALDTARLACAALDLEPVVLEALGAGFDAAPAEALLDAHRCACIVGHEPDLSMLAHHYSGARIDIKKGGIAALRLRSGSGELAVLLRPREIETLAQRL
ncbi:MAG: hypothetical protein NVSMB51_20360 [Solirubrobacteraceae bacterium]